MARNSTITKETFFETADRLLEEQGKPPTQGQMRDALGGGSFTTIGPLMKDWEAARAEQAEARETTVPDAVQVALSEVAGRLWQVASNEAALGVEAARREVEEMRKEAAAEAASSSEAIAIVEGERDAALERIEALNGDLSEVRSELDGVKKDLRGQIEARTRAETQVEAATARADRAEQERKIASEERLKVESEASSLRESNATMREKLAELSADNKFLSDQSSKMETRADRAEAKADAVQGQLTQVTADLSTARSDLVKERAEHNATKNSLSDRLDRALSDLESERVERNAVLDRLSEADAKIQQLISEKSTAEAQAKALASQLVEAKEALTKAKDADVKKAAQASS